MGAILSVAILSGCGSQTESREAAKVSEKGQERCREILPFGIPLPRDRVWRLSRRRRISL